MAENQKLSTMKEAMFREFFSDFDQLAERLEAIQKSMPGVAREIDIKLQPLRDDITALIGKLSEDSIALVDDSKNIIAQTAIHHRAELSELAAQLLEKQSVTVGKAVTAATSAAITTAVNQSVQVPVKEAVDRIVRVGNGLDMALEELKKARTQVSWSWWERIGGFLMAALIGGATVLILGKASGSIVSEKQFNQLVEKLSVQEQQGPARANLTKQK